MSQMGCLDAILWTKDHMKTTAAHNVHHKVNCQQWGGTFAATFGELATQVSEMGKDETGLGCWSWMLCNGLNGQAVCIIMAYNPNQSTCTKTKTIYCHINPISRAAATSLAQERHSYVTLNSNCGGGNPLEKNSLFLLT